MLGEIRLSSEARLVARKTLPDIQRRLQCLIEVGLGYLTLDRATRTLSGGEYQRARLAACLGAGLHVLVLFWMNPLPDFTLATPIAC